MSDTTTTAFALSNFRVVRHVTRPLLKIEENKPYYLKIDGAIRQAEQQKKPKMVKQGDGTEVPQPPPFIVDITNLVTGHPMQMVCNEVFRTELEKQYKDGSYVGKFFQFSKNTKAEGKNYNTFGITEIEPVSDEKTADTPAPSVKAPAKK